MNKKDIKQSQIDQQQIKERYIELQKIQDAQYVTGITEDKLLPMEQLLRRKTPRPLSEFPQREEKTVGNNTGYIGEAIFNSIEREHLPALEIDPLTTKYMVKAADLSAFNNPDIPEITGVLHPACNSSEIIKEYIAGPLYNLLLLGHSPKIGIIEQEKDQKNNTNIQYITSEFFDKFTGLDFAHRYIHALVMEIKARERQSIKVGPSLPIVGFEKVVIAAMLLGEIDSNPQNIGFIKTGDAVSNTEAYEAVKIDHGRALLNFPQRKEDLLEDLRKTFFPTTSGSPYSILLQHGIITFNPEKMKEAIDDACVKLDHDSLKRIISDRIERFAKQGADFNSILQDERYFKQLTMIDLHEDDLIQAENRPKNKKELVEFYVNNILKQKELMMEVSQDISKLLEDKAMDASVTFDKILLQWKIEAEAKAKERDQSPRYKTSPTSPASSGYESGPSSPEQNSNTASKSWRSILNRANKNPQPDVKTR